MLGKFLDLLHRAFVLLFPYRTTAEPVSLSVPPSIVAQPDADLCSKRIDGIADEARLEKQFQYWLDFVKDEDERRKSADARLTSIIGLSSIAATVVFGTLVALASGPVSVAEPTLRWFVALSAAYLSLQLGLAIRAAIQGLGMRVYLSIDIPDMIQTPTESHVDYLKRRFKWAVHELVDHSAHNDTKVLWMSVALASLRNFIIALMVMALCMSLYAGVR